MRTFALALALAVAVNAKVKTPAKRSQDLSDIQSETDCYANNWWNVWYDEEGECVTYDQWLEDYQEELQAACMSDEFWTATWIEEDDWSYCEWEVRVDYDDWENWALKKRASKNPKQMRMEKLKSRPAKRGDDPEDQEWEWEWESPEDECWVEGNIWEDGECLSWEDWLESLCVSDEYFIATWDDDTQECSWEWNWDESDDWEDWAAQVLRKRTAAARPSRRAAHKKHRQLRAKRANLSDIDNEDDCWAELDGWWYGEGDDAQCGTYDDWQAWWDSYWADWEDDWDIDWEEEEEDDQDASQWDNEIDCWNNDLMWDDVSGSCMTVDEWIDSLFADVQLKRWTKVDHKRFANNKKSQTKSRMMLKRKQDDDYWESWDECWETEGWEWDWMNDECVEVPDAEDIEDEDTCWATSDYMWISAEDLEEDTGACFGWDDWFDFYYPCDDVPEAWEIEDPQECYDTCDYLWNDSLEECQTGDDWWDWSMENDTWNWDDDWVNLRRKTKTAAKNRSNKRVSAKKTKAAKAMLHKKPAFVKLATKSAQQAGNGYATAAGVAFGVIAIAAVTATCTRKKQVGDDYMRSQ